MTPKEKAEDLVDKYRDTIISFLSDNMKDMNAKKYALIAVDEVLDYLNKIMIPNPFGQYWDEVRKEIENL